MTDHDKTPAKQRVSGAPTMSDAQLVEAFASGELSLHCPCGVSSPGEDRRLAYVRAYGRLNELVRLYLAGLMDRDWLACRREAIEQALENTTTRGES